MIHLLGLAVPVLLLGWPAASIQNNARPAQAQSADRLASIPQLASLSTSSPAIELTIRWDVAVPPGPTALPPVVTPSVDQFQVMTRRTVDGLPAPERNPQLSEDQLVVVAVNSQGTEIGWQMIRDPSLLRAEGPSASGDLTGQVLQWPRTSFILTLPQATPAIAELHVYRPHWTANGFTLVRLGIVVTQGAQ